MKNSVISDLVIILYYALAGMFHCSKNNPIDVSLKLGVC